MLLEYAIKEDCLVHVNDVSKGLECGCICPCCKKPVVAKKGDIKRYHFAHLNADCQYAVESALHIMAKEIIDEEKKIMLPRIENKIFVAKKGIIANEKIITIDIVKLENRQESIVPDVVIYKDDQKLFVEITVTHGISNEKMRFIKNMKISTLEIDLSHTDSMVSREDLRHVLVETSSRKRWVYNSYVEKYMEAFHQFCNKKGIRRKVVLHGCALHIENCPVNVRIWRGRPYANFIDDCGAGCKYFLGYEVENDTPENFEKGERQEFIYCGGLLAKESLESINSWINKYLKQENKKQKHIIDSLARHEPTLFCGAGTCDDGVYGHDDVFGECLYCGKRNRLYLCSYCKEGPFCWNCLEEHKKRDCK